MASREKISSNPLLIDITWHTNTKPYEFGFTPVHTWLPGSAHPFSTGRLQHVIPVAPTTL